MMSVASHGYKLLCKLYRKILGHQWVKRVIEQNPTLLRQPKRLHLEPLEPRILLNVTLHAGEWTYFDLQDNNTIDANDLFIGVTSGTVTLNDNTGGASRPYRIDATGPVTFFSNESLENLNLTINTTAIIDCY